MAIAEISFSDKSDINTTSTPEVNKITASNLNEIKSVVNTNANLMGDLETLTTSDKSSVVNAINSKITSYNIVAGTPVKTGKQIEGYDEYVVRVNLGSLPNNASKDYSLGFSINQLINVEGSSVRASDGNIFPLPFVSTEPSANITVLMFNTSTLRITTGSDRSNLTGYLNIYYI